MTEPADSQRLLAAFDGAIITRLIPHPHRSFAFEVTFDKTTWPASLTGKKPPLHFHPHQEEYMQVLEGHLCVEVDGKEMVLDPKDGEISVKPWINHRLYPPPDFGGTSIIKFLLSGQSTMELFRLDLTFFENWYGYQDEIVLTGKTMNIIQVMSMFDAGGSYLTLPSWAPFRCYMSQALGVVVGRWIGGLLGYPPFYRKWTGDWELACQKMESSFFQKRFADRRKTV